MPTIKVYPHGTTAGTPPQVNSHIRAKRGKVGGWSTSSIRSNTRFLYSVRVQGLIGQGWALSLTLRDCPATHDDWHRLRRKFFERLRRMGMLRAHWLTEWQRRGCPHLHAAVWLPEPGSDSDLLTQRERMRDAWLAVAGEYGAGPHSQDLKPISDAIGWFQYVSKHASRGLYHYQRAPERVPKGWERTGRMWGYMGSWDLQNAVSLETDFEAYWQYRRWLRRYCIANARTGVVHSDPAKRQAARRRIEHLRRALKDSEPERSAVRGLSEWVPQEVTLTMLITLGASGYGVEHV